MDLKNTLAAVSLSAAIIVLWGLFFAPDPQQIKEGQLEKEKKWPPHLILRQNKYMNNIIEQDHRRVKWKMNHAMGYHSMWHAWATTTGVEIMHIIKKGQLS